MMDDAVLLSRYAQENDEAAFAEFVRRNLPLVYASALRRLKGDVHRAEEVAQVVFCAAARDAAPLSRHRALTGWLYVATRHAVVDRIRADTRRHAREHHAYLMSDALTAPSTSADWSQLCPVLDQTMDQLGETDREAVLLRFFEGRTFAEIGATLDLTEEAARKRVDRAVDRLRELLRSRGLTSTSAALATTLSPLTLSSAPASLAASVTSAALAKASVSLTPLIFMQLTKLQTGFVALLAAGGIAGLVVQQRTIAQLRTDLTQTEIRRSGLVAEGSAPLPQPVTITPAEPPHEVIPKKNATRTTVVALTSAPSSTSSSPEKVTSETDRIAEKAKLHRRYDSFLQRYGLTAEQQERFVELKLALADARADLQTAVREANATGGSTTVEAMRKKMTEPMWAEIRQLLGDEGYRAYGDYERSSFYRVGIVGAMESSFTTAGASLSDQQSDQLAQTVAASTRSTRLNSTDIGNTAQIDWAAVLTQSQQFLTPAQLGVLQAIALSQRSPNQQP